VQRSILELLRVLHIPAWRINSRVLLLPGKGGRLRPVRMGGVKGMADILALLPPGGRLVAIECKRTGNHPTKDQSLFLEAVAHAGGLSLVAHSAQDVVQALAREGWRG